MSRTDFSSRDEKGVASSSLSQATRLLSAINGGLGPKVGSLESEEEEEEINDGAAQKYDATTAAGEKYLHRDSIDGANSTLHSFIFVKYFNALFQASILRNGSPSLT